jgi:hypothetical protein
MSFPGTVCAEDWRTEFDEICSKVQEGNSLDEEELRALIRRADVLMERIRNLDIEPKNVYLFRLKKCRAFFQYIIEPKERDKSGS